MNCHYVTRGLTKPWEFENRTLKYFDFTTGNMENGDSKTLFAIEDLNTPQEEKFLKDFVETPLIGFRDAFISSGKTDTKKWKVFRALFLYFGFHTARITKTHIVDRSSGKEFETLLGKDETFFDQLTSAYLESYDIATLNVPDGFCLFFPESGLFTLPVQDSVCPTGWTFLFGIPITVFTALILKPKSVDFSTLDEDRKLLEAFSVGQNSKSTKVLIPPQAYNATPEVQIIEAIKEHRKKAIEHVALINDLQNQVKGLYNAFGLDLIPT